MALYFALCKKLDPLLVSVDVHLDVPASLTMFHAFQVLRERSHEYKADFQSFTDFNTNQGNGLPLELLLFKYVSTDRKVKHLPGFRSHNKKLLFIIIFMCWAEVALKEERKT